MQKYTEKVHSEREEEPEIVWVKRTAGGENKETEETTDNSENKPKLPIVYSKNYGVNFAKLEKLHPFDAQKGKNIQEVR